MGVKGISGTGYGTGFLKSTNFNIGPYIRYYFLNADNVINVFSEGSYQFGFISGTNSYIANNNNFIFSAGPVFFINSVIGLELVASYKFTKYPKINRADNHFMFGVGLQVHLEHD